VLVEGANELGPKEVGLLEDFGGTVTTIAGRVAVLRTQTANLNSIAHLPFITRVERTWPLSIYLDKSVPDVGANVVWDEVKDPTGRNVTGSGVIVGFVDTGIDWSHPDFTFPNGTTKILYIWDQTNNTIPSAAPTGFSYGYECVSSDIQAAKCPERDTFGHGTHVAGIATSSGRATGNYTGVAPGSSIIFVKSGHELCNGTSWTFDSSQILDGVNYIVEKAAQLGRRAVINLSLGGNIGGHDGTDPMEIALDSFVKKGTPIVVAAGNQEQDNAHIQGQLTKGGSVTFNVGLKETTTDLAIDVWYSAEDLMTATLLTPDGKSYSTPTSTQTTQARFGNATVAAMTGSSDLGRIYVPDPDVGPSAGQHLRVCAHAVLG
jgi:minor extracellular serine protease Vpr